MRRGTKRDGSHETDDEEGPLREGDRGREREKESDRKLRGKKSPLLRTIKFAGGAAAVQRGTFLLESLSLSLSFSPVSLSYPRISLIL